MKNLAALKKASEFKFTPTVEDRAENAAIEAARSFITANLAVKLEYYNEGGQVGFEAVAGRDYAVRIENNGVIDKQYITPKYLIDLTKVKSRQNLKRGTKWTGIVMRETKLSRLHLKTKRGACCGTWRRAYVRSTCSMALVSISTHPASAASLAF